MDLTFQVSRQYCSSQHQTLLLPSDTPTVGLHFCFDSTSLFFLELFFHTSPVAYWIPTNLGHSSSGVISFCLFVLFMRFSWQEYWSGLPPPPPGDHILSELFPMTHPSWVALHGVAHCVIQDRHFLTPFPQLKIGTQPPPPFLKLLLLSGLALFSNLSFT